jgi:CRP-like cAMP-binding protein
VALGIINASGPVGLWAMAQDALHDALIDPLRGVALFQGLSPAQLAEIARQTERIVFRPDDKIIEEGGQGDAAFLIVAGDAVRTAGPELHEAPERIPPGSLIGEMAMLIEIEHSSTIVAEGSVRALKITRANLHSQMADDPSLAEHFVAKITLRLHALAENLRKIDRALAVDCGARASRYLSLSSAPLELLLADLKDPLQSGSCPTSAVSYAQHPVPSEA